MGPMAEASVSVTGAGDGSFTAVDQEAEGARADRNHRHRALVAGRVAILAVGVVASIVGAWTQYSSARSAARGRSPTGSIRGCSDPDNPAAAQRRPRPACPGAHRDAARSHERRVPHVVPHCEQRRLGVPGRRRLRLPRACARLTVAGLRTGGDSRPGWRLAGPSARASCRRARSFDRLARLGIRVLPVAFPPALDVCTTGAGRALVDVGATGGFATLPRTITLGQFAATQSPCSTGYAP